MTFIKKEKWGLFFRFVIWSVLVSFTFETLGFHSAAYAQSYLQSLPVPGTMVSLSSAHAPMLMKGIKTYPDNPFRFDFFIDPGQDTADGQGISKESTKLIKYFLAALTVPEDQLWVNLSPYESDRIMPAAFGITEMGRDLLAQDYLLKQISASLLDPSTERGAEFWEKVYVKIRELGGNAGAVNTFNKVWIVPESADVYTKGGNAFVVDSRLKVMLEEDYEALANQQASAESPSFVGTGRASARDVDVERSQFSPVVREVIIAALEKEVNEGKNFAMLRQVYHSMILATWFKRHLRESVLGKIYIGQNKVGGVDVDDKDIKEKIYQQYLTAFKKGVFDFIREDYDPSIDETVPRKYFAGGVDLTSFGALASSSLNSPYRESSDAMSLRKVNLRPANFLGQPFYRVSSVVISKVGVNWYDSLNLGVPEQIAASAVSSPKENMNVTTALIAQLSQKSFAKGALRRLSGIAISTILLFSSLGFATQAQGAQFSIDENRGMVVHIEKNDTLGSIVQTLRAQKKLKSELSGTKLWGKSGAVEQIAQAMNLTNPNHLLDGGAYVIPAEFLSGMGNEQVVEITGQRIASPQDLQAQDKTFVAAPDAAFSAPAGSFRDNPLSRSSDLPARLIAEIDPKVEVEPSVKSIFQPSFLSDENRYPLSVSLIENGSTDPFISPGASISKGMHPLVPITLTVILASMGLMVRPRPGEEKVTLMPTRASKPLVSHSGFDEVVTGAVEAAMSDSDDFVVPDLSANPPSPEELARAKELESDFGVPETKPSPPSTEEVRRADAILNEQTFVAGLRNQGNADENHSKDGGTAAQYPAQLERDVMAERIVRAHLEVTLGINDIGNDFVVPETVSPTPPDAGELARAEESEGDFGVPNNAPTPPSSEEIARAKMILDGARVTALGGGAGARRDPLLGTVSLAEDAQQGHSWWTRFLLGIAAVTGFVGFIANLGLDPGMVSVILACGNWGIFARLSDAEIAALKKKAESGKKKYFSTDFFPKWMRTSIQRQLEILTLRGGESMGGTMFTSFSSRTVAIMAKVLKAKRGGDLFKSWERKFDQQIKTSIQKGVTPLKDSQVLVVTGHVRLPTGGPSLLEAAHPFTTTYSMGANLYALYRGQQGQFEAKDLWELREGELVPITDNVIVTIAANGDNDSTMVFDERIDTKQLRDYYAEIFKHELGEAYQWVKEPDEFGQLPEKHRIVNGDSPPIALAILERLTQGNLKASRRFARNRVINKNLQEVMDPANGMTLEDEALLDKGDQAILAKHAKKLSRPGYDKKSKSWSDLWATAEMVKSDPRWFSQFEALEQLRAELLNRYIALRDEPVKAMSKEGKIVRDWKHTDDADLAAFVDLMVERFFIGDRHNAVREFAELATGTFGLQVRDSRNPRSVTLYANEQGLAIGYSMKGGFLTYSSEHSSMMVEYGKPSEGGRGYLDNIIFLDSQAPGHIADITVNGTGRLFDLSVYSMGHKRQLTKGEILGNSFPQTANNPYFRKPLEYKNPDDVPAEERAKIPQGAAELRSQWDDKDSHLRRSAEAMFGKFVSRDLEYYLKSNSMLYGVIQGKIVKSLDYILENTVKPEDRARIMHQVQADSILPYMKDYLDRLIAQHADDLAGRLIDGTISEDDLFTAQQEFDRTLHERFREELKNIVKRILDQNFKFFQDWLAETKAKGGQDALVGAGEIDFLQLGYEGSENLGHQFGDMLKVFFPRMRIKTISSNAGLSLNGQDGVGRRTVAMVASKSGATSPSKTSIPRLKRIMPDNVFVHTNRVDTLAALSLGQRFLSDSPFSERIFYTGDYFRSEAVNAGEALMMVNNMELALYLAKRFRELYKVREPFAMSQRPLKGETASIDADIKELERQRDLVIVGSAEKLIGVKADGTIEKTPVHQTLVKKGKHLGKSITETPVTNLIFRIFVFLVFMFGGPVQGLFEVVTGIPVPPVSELLGFGLRFLDFSLAVTFQWLFTTFIYRAFSKRLKWARTGTWTLAVNDPSLMVRESLEMFAVKLGAMAPGSMHAHVLSTDPTNDTAAKLLPRLGRGLMAVFSIPEDPDKKKQVLLTINQAAAVKNGILGQKMKAGPEIFAFFHGNGADAIPAAVRHKIDLGVPDVQRITPRVMKFAEFYREYERYLAGKVMLDEAYRYASTIKIGSKVVNIWERWKTFFRTGVLSTSIPVMESKEEVEELGENPFEKVPLKKNLTAQKSANVRLSTSEVGSSQQSQTPVADASNIQASSSSALTQTPSLRDVALGVLSSRNRGEVGGIDLNPRSLKLNVKGDPSLPRPPAPDFILDPQMINNLPMDYFAPMIIEVVPVPTVEMFLGLPAVNPIKDLASHAR